MYYSNQYENTHTKSTETPRRGTGAGRRRPPCASGNPAPHDAGARCSPRSADPGAPAAARARGESAGEVHGALGNKDVEHLYTLYQDV